MWFGVPLIEVYGVEDFIYRYAGFVITAGVISIISYRLNLTEQQFRSEEQRLSVISDSLNDTLITINEDSKITLVSPAVERMFGWTPQEIISKPITVLMPEALRKAHLAEFNTYVTSGKKTFNWKAVEALGMTKQGKEFPVEIAVGEFFHNGKRLFSAVIRDISERKQIEVKIAELASIVESSEDAILSNDLNGIVKTWNQGSERLFGYTAKEMIGQDIIKLFPEGYEHEKQKIIKKVGQGTELDHYETKRKTKDGTVIDVSLTISPVKDSLGKVVGVSKIIRNITIKKRQDAEIEHAKERYKAFIENSEEAIWMVDYRKPINTALSPNEQLEMMYSEGFIAEANPQMAALYATSDPIELIGKPWTVVVPRSLKTDKFLLQYIKNGYTMLDFPSQRNDKNGNLRFSSTTFKGIIKEGFLVRAWTVQRDITAKKVQEKELENGQERYQTFIQTSEEGIWRVEFKEGIDISLPHEQQVDSFFEEGYIAEANESTAKVLNIDYKSSLLNKPLHQVAPRTLFDERFLAGFLANGYTASSYESTDTIANKTLYYSTSMKGIIEDGRWVRTWMVRRDITSQKQHLIERERLLKETEDAKKALELASSEKDRFLANLSHELRTPLVSILGYSAMLLDTQPSPEDSNKMIETINKNAKLQVTLIEDLLDLSRIISGKIELNRKFFKVGEFARDNADTLRQQAKEKGLKLYENYDECNFYGDRKRLSQILLNLLSNAVKFTEKGEITISVRCSDKGLTLQVCDTGIGIDDKNFHLLFQPFKQLDSSSTRIKQGLGLGLSIVKNIAELHGGTVRVDSKLGEGSEFTVFLPTEENSETGEVEVTEDIHITPPTEFDGICILLVEDDADSAGFIKYLYEKKGAEVDWVKSAKDARKAIPNKNYDIYIFDLSMPEEDGLSLMKSVRDTKDVTKAVALTAFADSYYEQKALDAGFDMFLKKPTSLPDLLSIIKLVR